MKEYNQLWMELDDIYRNCAKNCGLSDCAFWIFYTIYENKEVYTQKDLAETLSISRQTINSALKSLEASGFIALVPLSGQRKNKQVILTESGNKLAKKVIEPVIKAEQNAFGDLKDDEQETLLRLTQTYIDLLRSKTSKIDI